MKIELATMQVTTDDGRFLKTLYCPKDKEWKELHAKGSTTGRYCDHCECTVHDTTGMTDDDLVNLLQTNPKACLAISPTQLNCTVIP